MIEYVLIFRTLKLWKKTEKQVLNSDKIKAKKLSRNYHKKQGLEVNFTCLHLYIVHSLQADHNTCRFTS